MGNDMVGENKRIEYKQEIPERHEKFLKDILAFANSSGGQVVIGVVDKTLEVIGIGEQNPFKLVDSITKMIYDSCEPMLEPDVYPGTIDTKTVIYVDVAPGKQRPYYLKSVGKEKSTYVRINGISVPASERRIRELEMEGMRVSYDMQTEIGRAYDEQEAEKLCEDMEKQALLNCVTSEQKKSVKPMTIQKLEDFGILHREGKEVFPTHAYSLLTDNRNMNAVVQCARFKDNNRKVFLDKREMDGPIYQQVEDAYQFVLKHINLGVDIKGIHSVDVYELPTWSIREIIANAIIHRSYLVESCVQVSIYDDRVEVSSPGTLYDGLDLEKAMSGTSRCRNAAIAAAFQYMRIIDRWGTGIPRILEEFKEYGLPMPIFQEDGDGMKVIVYRKISSGPQETGTETTKADIEDQETDTKAQKLGVETQETGTKAQKLGVEAQETDIKAQKLGVEFFEEILDAQNVPQIYISNIKKIFDTIGTEEIFGRSVVVQILKCSDSTGDTIIRTMKNVGMIEKVTGHGKGKYRFVDKR